MKQCPKRESGKNRKYEQINSVQVSRSVMSNSSWPHGPQHARPPYPSPTPGVYLNSSPLSWWCHPSISSSGITFYSRLQSFQHQGLFQWVSSSHQVAKVLEFQFESFQWIFRTDFLWDGLVGSPCSPRDSQESSPTPQSKSINSLVLSFLYSPVLTSTFDFWKTKALTGRTFVGKVMSLLSNMLSRLVITFLPRSKCSFMAVVTICSDFGATKNEVCHCWLCLSQIKVYHYFIFTVFYIWKNSGFLLLAISNYFG